MHRAALSATAGEGLADPGSLEFGELFERLVALSVRGIAARKAGEESEAARLEALAEKVLDLLRNRVPESDSAALHELTGILSEDHTERSRVCRALCLGLLRFGLARRLARFEHGGSRRALDDLVHALLACLPQDERIAAELSGLLIGARYLGIVHEQAILDLALTATEDGFLVPHVVRLLETLWRNLEASGARSSTELAS
ncbi:MAG: hypothetical protein KDC87_20590, partial [Planctomycetes bacterium]|nr:hypothetical protein [Planctomycetota bacterium]